MPTYARMTELHHEHGAQRFVYGIRINRIFAPELAFRRL